MNKLDELQRRQTAEAKLAALRTAIDEGDASGVAEGDVFARVRETLALLGQSCSDRVRNTGPHLLRENRSL
jgi:hypothetical protein